VRYIPVWIGYEFNGPVYLGPGFSLHMPLNSIGTRSVIGANAVVSRSIPAYCLAAGVPARVLDYFGPEGSEPAELARNGSAG